MFPLLRLLRIILVSLRYGLDELCLLYTSRCV